MKFKRIMEEVTKTWRRGRHKYLTDAQREEAVQRQKNRAKISNIVARKPELENICCICGKAGQILHNNDNPYYISFICADCRQDPKKVKQAEAQRFDLRTKLNRNNLSTTHFTKKQVKEIVERFNRANAKKKTVTIGDYCNDQNITRHQFSKLLELYEQYYPQD